MRIHLIITDGKKQIKIPLPDVVGAFDAVAKGTVRMAGTVYGTLADALRPITGLGERVINEIKEDVAAVKQRDPAARDNVEILLLNSGVHAILAYRVAHKLYLSKKYFSARAVSQLAKHVTGIEIHPGATIGHGFFIDHGTGVVIGETCEIGDNCTLYQGVTLGGTGKDTGKRHPTLGNNVMVGAGAKVLGPFKIGDNSKIAAGAVVLTEIPENCTAVGIPAKVVRRDGEKVSPEEIINAELDQVNVPDPLAQQISGLEEKIASLTEDVASLMAKKRRSYRSIGKVSETDDEDPLD